MPTGDGWNEPHSKATTDAAKRTAENLTLVPLDEGGIQIEMHAGGWDIEIEIDEDGTVVDVWTQDLRDVA